MTEKRKFQSRRAGGRQGWMTLGSFYFSQGEAKITLSDKGSGSNQIIFADAVKWVYTNNNK